jgi:hypothetical protein
MADDDFPPIPSLPRRSQRAGGTAAPNRRRRLIFRLLALPILAALVFLLFNGLRDYLQLPKCDSDHAKEWLGEALQSFKFDTAHAESIKTIASSKQEVVCSADLSLPSGSKVTVDYSFYWSGNKVNMKYSVPLTGSGSLPPAAPAPAPDVPVR